MPELGSGRFLTLSSPPAHGRLAEVTAIRFGAPAIDIAARTLRRVGTTIVAGLARALAYLHAPRNDALDVVTLQRGGLFGLADRTVAGCRAHADASLPRPVLPQTQAARSSARKHVKRRPTADGGLFFLPAAPGVHSQGPLGLTQHKRLASWNYGSRCRSTGGDQPNRRRRTLAARSIAAAQIFGRRRTMLAWQSSPFCQACATWVNARAPVSIGAPWGAHRGPACPLRTVLVAIWAQTRVSNTSSMSPCGVIGPGRRGSLNRTAAPAFLGGAASIACGWGARIGLKRGRAQLVSVRQPQPERPAHVLRLAGDSAGNALEKQRLERPPPRDSRTWHLRAADFSSHRPGAEPASFRCASCGKIRQE